MVQSAWVDGQVDGEQGNGDFEKLIKPGFDPNEQKAEFDVQSGLPPVDKEVETNVRNQIEREQDEMYERRFAVHIAANEGEVGALEKAIDALGHFQAFDDTGRTPLFYACAQNNVECSALLLNRRIDLINLGDVEGDRPLHVAAYYGHKEVLDLLLQYQADVNARNNKGYTPLHVCSSVECCKTLMDYNSDVYAQDENGRVPLFAACATDKKRIVTEILNYPRYDAEEMLPIQDSFGDTAVHAAACNGSLDCIKALKGFMTVSLLQVKNYEGYTAQELAGVNHQYECEQYIGMLFDTLFKKEESNNRRLTHYIQQQTSTWSMHNQPSSYDVRSNSFYGGSIRPGTAGGVRGGMHGGSGRSTTFHIPNTSQYFDLQRPQTAQSFNESYGLPPIGVDNSYAGLQMEEQDLWNAFSKPYDEYYGNNEGYDNNNNAGNNFVEYNFDGGLYEHDRPKTPWTLRREQGTMENWCGEWAEFVDKETNRPFWWNAITGECKWEPPAQQVQQQQQQQPQGGGNDYYSTAQQEETVDPQYKSEAEQIRQRSYVLDKIESWSECQDPLTGDIFYYNNETGECEWELPRELEEKRQKQKLEEKKKLEEEAEKEAAEWMLNMKNKIVSSPKTSSTSVAAWETVKDEASGEDYYVNKETGEKKWEKPKELESLASIGQETTSLVVGEEAQEGQDKEDINNKRNDADLEELKAKFKAEAAAEIAEQVKAVISSTEEERERLRKEFEAQMKAQAEQTEMLAKKLEAEDLANQKKREAEILAAKDKVDKQEEKQKRTEEKAELLAEHGEELKQLAAVISADRQRQNEKLQEKLQERRRARALKRAQMLNQANKEGGLKTPKSAKTPGSQVSGKNRPNLAIIQQNETEETKQANESNNKLVELESIILLTKPCEDILRKAMTATSQLRLFVSTHLQYLPSDEAKKLQMIEFGKTILPIIWALYRTFCLEDQRTPLPKQLYKNGFRKFLDDGNLKLSLHDRDKLLKSLYSSSPKEEKKREEGLNFQKFQLALKKAIQVMGCDVETFYKEKIVPICVKASLMMEKRGKRYQKESKSLATDQVRKLLQTNVSQLKLLYLYYSMVAEKRKSPCEKKTITFEEAMLFARDFGMLSKMCSPKHLTELFEDMTLRKPNPPSALQNFPLPFNQFVQLLFHASVRFQQQQQDQDAHISIISFLEGLDKSGGKTKVKVKGVKPFICIV